MQYSDVLKGWIKLLKEAQYSKEAPRLLRRYTGPRRLKSPKERAGTHIEFSDEELSDDERLAFIKDELRFERDKNLADASEVEVPKVQTDADLKKKKKKRKKKLADLNPSEVSDEDLLDYVNNKFSLEQEKEVGNRQEITRDAEGNKVRIVHNADGSEKVITLSKGSPGDKKLYAGPISQTQNMRQKTLGITADDLPASTYSKADIDMLRGQNSLRKFGTQVQPTGIENYPKPPISDTAINDIYSDRSEKERQIAAHRRMPQYMGKQQERIPHTRQAVGNDNGDSNTPFRKIADAIADPEFKITDKGVKTLSDFDYKETPGEVWGTKDLPELDDIKPKINPVTGKPEKKLSIQSVWNTYFDAKDKIFLKTRNPELAMQSVVKAAKDYTGRVQDAIKVVKAGAEAYIDDMVEGHQPGAKLHDKITKQLKDDPTFVDMTEDEIEDLRTDDGIISVIANSVGFKDFFDDWIMGDKEIERADKSGNKYTPKTKHGAPKHIITQINNGYINKDMIKSAINCIKKFQTFDILEQDPVDIPTSDIAIKLGIRTDAKFKITPAMAYMMTADLTQSRGDPGLWKFYENESYVDWLKRHLYRRGEYNDRLAKDAPGIMKQLELEKKK